MVLADHVGLMKDFLDDVIDVHPLEEKDLCALQDHKFTSKQCGFLSKLFEHTASCMPKSRHFALVEELRGNEKLARNGFRSGFGPTHTSLRSLTCDHDYFFELQSFATYTPPHYLGSKK